MLQCHVKHDSVRIWWTIWATPSLGVVSFLPDMIETSCTVSTDTRLYSRYIIYYSSTSSKTSSSGLIFSNRYTLYISELNKSHNIYHLSVIVSRMEINLAVVLQTPCIMKDPLWHKWLAVQRPADLSHNVCILGSLWTTLVNFNPSLD